MIIDEGNGGVVYNVIRNDYLCGGNKAIIKVKFQSFKINF